MAAMTCATVASDLKSSSREAPTVRTVLLAQKERASNCPLSQQQYMNARRLEQLSGLPSSPHISGIADTGDPNLRSLSIPNQSNGPTALPLRTRTNKASLALPLHVNGSSPLTTKALGATTPLTEATPSPPPIAALVKGPSIVLHENHQITTHMN